MAALTPVKMITSKKPADPKFTGFHRLEKALFGDNTTKGMDQYADQLYTDVVDLQNASVNWLSHLQKWSAVQPD